MLFSSGDGFEGYRVLDSGFYMSDAVSLARRLLGMILVSSLPEGLASGRIVETEAYAGRSDAACHSYGRDRKDPLHRTAPMFDAGGHAYVYLIYGMYCCFNAVANTAGEPEAVLIRALEPIDGLPLMARRRRVDESELKLDSGLKKLCSGPGKLAMALGISTAWSGLDLTCGEGLFIAYADAPNDRDVLATPRINISYAGDAASYPYRFVIRDSKFLSTRRHVPKEAT
jgi:DNA-3-methyladenine glycosylase